MKNFLKIQKLMIDYSCNLKTQKPSMRLLTAVLRKLEVVPKDMVLKTRYLKKRRVSWLIFQITSKGWNL